MAIATANKTNVLNIAFVGFGEAASAFVSGWNGAAPVNISAFDIKTDAGGEVREQKLANYEAAGVRPCETAGAAAGEADVIFSLVTADQTLAAARSVAGSLRSNTLFFDCNSCAPETKRQAAKVICQTGGRYLDVAIMAPVHPHLHRTPMFVSGADTPAALEVMRTLDMSARQISGEIGAASAIKLVRSIMVKGLEALATECALVGRKLGVDKVVFETLEDTYPNFGWTARAAHMLERVMVHGQRRAEEMREATAMVEDLGLPGRMARATVSWQQQVGELALTPDGDGYRTCADKILRGLGNER